MNEVLDKNQQEKRMETILSYPLNQVRYWASEQFAAKKFSPKTFEELVNKTRPLASDSDLFEKELENVRKALETGKAPNTPNLSNPQNQLIWGAALATIANTPDLKKSWDAENVSSSMVTMPLWSQLAHSPDARTELRENAFILATSLKNPQTRIRWGAPDGGYPDVSYYYMPSKNLINLDMVWSLMIGMEQARSANLHEIGHSQGTINQPKGVLRAREELKELKEKTKDKNLTKEERRDVRTEGRKKSLENELRYLIFDEAENNYANKYAVNQSARSRQDFSVAINTLETTLCLPLVSGMDKADQEAALAKAEAAGDMKGVLDAVVGTDKEPKQPGAMDHFINLKKVIRYSFYVNNGIAEDSDAGWASLGIHKEWLSGVDKEGNKIDAEHSFKDLRTLCTKLEELQPTARDRLRGQDFYNKRMEECSEQRCEIIDEIFDRFVGPMLPDLFNEREEQREQQKQNQKSQQNENGEQGDQQQSGGGSGENSEGSEGMESGEGQSGQSSGGQQSEGGGRSSGGDSEFDDDGDDDDAGNETDLQKKIDEMKRQMSDSIKKMMGDEEKEDTGSKDGKESDGKDSNSKDSDGKEGQEGKPGKEGQEGKNKQDQNKDQGETLEDLVKNQNNSENTKTSGENDDGSQNSEQNKGKRQEVWKGQEKKGGKLTINDFLPERLRETNEYKEIVARHQQTARKVKNLLAKLQNEYFGKEVESRKRTLVPEDTDISKFDLDSYVERRKKLATGQEVDERDYEHFKVRGAKEKTPAPIDIAILIDRSGSMGKGEGSKLDLALSTACVLYEAARKNPYFNVYITAMGEPKALEVAVPGQSEDEIAKKIMTVQDVCGGCQDHMKDAIVTTMDKIRGNKKQEYAGTSHFFVISDGNFGDEASSVPVVKQICENSKDVTFNFILTEKNKNMIEALSDDMSKGMGSERIDRVHLSSEGGIETALTSMLNRRMVEMKRVEAKRNTQKTAQMGKLLDAINGQRKR